MKRGSRITFCYLMLCVGVALAAQEPTPESKAEPGQQQSPAPQPRRVKLIPITATQGVPQAVVVKKVPPEYPKQAREAHIQGQVVLKVTISREGDVSKVELVSGHPMLVQAAIDAVKQWKYQPFLLNGQPSERETEAVVKFSLEPGEGHPGTAPPATPPAAATGVVGDAPGGIPPDSTSGVIGGIISSTPAVPHIATPQRVRVSGGVSNGLILKKVNPQYPPEALKGRIQGTVVMHAIIGKTGDIANLELVSGHPLLAPAAIEAVKQWKYKPYLLNGNAVEVDTLIQVNFTLSRD